MKFDHTGKITSVEDNSASSDGVNAWEAEFDGDPDATMIGAVIVRGKDRRDNAANTEGWTDDNGDKVQDSTDGNGEPNVGEELDLAELGDAWLLAEFDDNIDDAGVTLNPSVSEDDLLKTESRQPVHRVEIHGR